MTRRHESTFPLTIGVRTCPEPSRHRAGTAAVLALAGLVLLSAAACSAQTDRERRLEALKALPYVTWTEKKVPESEHGVTLCDTLRAWGGYTLYSGRDHATLIDMSGRYVNTWRNDALKEWEHAEMTDDGALYALLQRRGLYRLNWEGDIVWSAEVPIHHDFALMPDGSVLALAYDEASIPEIAPDPVETDKLVLIRPDGSFSDVWRLCEHRDELLKWCPEESVDSVSRDVPEDDWSHMNTVEAITGAHAHPAFRPGRVLVCVRNLDFVGVVDLTTGAIVWGWGPGVLDHPHQPTLMENGHILVFDNGFFRGWSRVVEYDPLQDRIVWQYEAPDRYDFFSRGRGSCQSLPNGDVLITESAKGRVFEVTREGEVVWEFMNPDRHDDRRGTFYRSERYSKELVDPLLESGGRRP
jgi:hypothetical protein